jgi:hypothetical protein
MMHCVMAGLVPAIHVFDLKRNRDLEMRRSITHVL